MAVVPLTLTISLCLVFTFVVFFLSEHARGRLSSVERDSLLPLADEILRPAQATDSNDATRPDRNRRSGGGPTGPGALKRGR
jgi:hypothetical protein